MKIRHIIFLDRRKVKLAVIKSILLRLSFVSPHDFKHSGRIRAIINLIKTTSFFFTAFAKLKKTGCNNFVFFGGVSDRHKKIRAYHITKHAPVQDLHFVDPGGKLFFHKLDVKTFFNLTSIYLEFIFVYLRLLIRPGIRTGIDSVYYIFTSVFQLALLDKSKANAYLYLLESYSTYVTALIAGEVLKMPAIHVVAGSVPFYWRKHYTCLPRVNLICCSVLQKDELKIFQKYNWVQVRSVEYWGLEESIQIDKLTPEKPAYDIAVYSSGCWDRDAVGFRHDYRERGKREGVYPAYEVFAAIIELIARLQKKFKLKVILYPHPHERVLIKKGIYPPYMDDIKKMGFDFDLSGTNSLDEIYKSRIGVAVMSNIITDRINLGLVGLALCQRKYATGFQRKRYSYYGLTVKYLSNEHADICFKDMDELEQKLIKFLT